MIVPKALEKYLNSRKFIVQDIHFHSKKLRYVIRVSNELFTTHFILKWQNEKNLFHLELLQNEIEYYLVHSGLHFLPEMVDYGENYFLTLNLKGSSTMRDWIGDNYFNNRSKVNQTTLKNEYESIIDNLFNYFEYSRNCSVSNLGKANEECRFTIMFNSNLFSAPNSLQKSSLRYITKMIYFINYRAISKVKKYVNHKLLNQTKGHIHGDLHLNNIVVSRNNIYIIDLENNRLGYLFEDVVWSVSFVKYAMMHKEFETRFLYSNLKKYANNYSEYSFLKLSIEFLTLALTINYEFSYDKSLLQFLSNAFMFGFRFKILMRLNKI